ncbi:MAG: cysteine methyltransferase [Candidatus Aenigmarchaeota archaeon ex4484_56]|nr:MAG: cysteine methyltransferase [Candidatus Aenigmarchaeota archaeon ex4484_56]
MKNKIFDLVRKIPYGKITTYKEIAFKLNINPRVVGKILSENENLSKIKCYKVVRSDGRVGGYILGKPEKIRRLKEENIEIEKDIIINFKERLHKF